MKRNGMKLSVILVVSSALLFMLSSCNKKTMEKATILPALAPLDAEKVALKGESCSSVVEGQITAWQSRDKKELERVYTDDIVHHDGRREIRGIRSVTGMAEMVVWANLPEWEMKTGATYISNDICFGEWLNWGMFGFSEEVPGIEYDWLEFNEDGIYFWRLFYDKYFLDEFNEPQRIDSEFLTNFTVAWSEQNEEKILALYSVDGQIEDTLFGVHKKGTDEIASFVSSFVVQFPEAEWHLIDGFAEGEAAQSKKVEYPFTYQGGIMEIQIPDSESGSCTILAAVLLAPDEDGKIASQKMFHEPQSLISCGLAK